MTSSIATFFTIFMVSACGGGAYTALSHNPCATDAQCPPGYFCYEESHYCTQCVDCQAYKRKPSWLSCPKLPSNCGACISGFEEEILHQGVTRDMCNPSSLNTALGQNITRSPGPDYGRYLFAAAVTAFFLPIVFYAFCWKNRARDRGSVHRSLSNDEPPPYRSVELSTLSSNNSVELLTEENHELRVRQQKESPVQAVPFRQPDYMHHEPEFLAFDNNSQESNSEDPNEPMQNLEEVFVPNLDQDENTMPSDWVPEENPNNNNNQLMSFHLSEPVEVSSDSEDPCEPTSKRHKPNQHYNHEENFNSNLNISLVINHNVTIHKPS